MVSIKAINMLSMCEKQNVQRLLNLSDNYLTSIEQNIIIYFNSFSNDEMSFIIIDTSPFGYNQITQIYVKERFNNIISMAQTILKSPIVFELNGANKIHYNVLYENQFVKFSSKKELSNIFDFDLHHEEVMVYCKIFKKIKK
jgi:hypothetical protein